MLVHVLLYEVGKDNEGIHSIDIKGKTMVLMFEEMDDAERYRGLLEAQDFPIPSIERIDKGEIELFCENAGYESKLVEKGFLPQTEEERLFISPPEHNLGCNRHNSYVDNQESNPHDDNSNNLENIRKQLENLL